jgi:hypothetical protein
MAPLVGEGGADFVSRHGDFAPLVAALIERRVRAAGFRNSKPVSALPAGPADSFASFPALSSTPSLEQLCEFLRHQINNPLTGILGNAELLLRASDRTSQTFTKRLETIVTLAVRLRGEVSKITHNPPHPRRIAPGKMFSPSIAVSPHYGAKA